jgi:hypothetical protein
MQDIGNFLNHFQPLAFFRALCVLKLRVLPAEQGTVGEIGWNNQQFSQKHPFIRLARVKLPGYQTN